MKIVSVNVGLPREMTWKGMNVSTGIFKTPVNGRVKIGQLNLAGDKQADLAVHGGADKAVYAYPAEHYEYWRRDFNSTYSKSIDVGSNAERINEFEGFGCASQVINSWSPKQLRTVSDFDATHQFNTNWIYELPVSNGKHFGGGVQGVAEALAGGWVMSGIFRLTSGYPFSVEPGLGYWPTNWQLTSAAVLVGKRPKTGVFIDPSGNPNVFQGDPTQLGIVQNYTGGGTLTSITSCPPGGCIWRVACPASRATKQFSRAGLLRN